MQVAENKVDSKQDAVSVFGVFDLEEERVNYFNSYEKALDAFDQTNGAVGVILFVAGQSRNQVLRRK